MAKSDWHLLYDEIVVDVTNGMEEVAEKVSGEIKERVGVPVGYEIGPKGGTKKIRSRRGEPPRKDSGQLQAEIRSETMAVGDQSQAVVESPTPYSERLQEELDRPITDGYLEATEDLMLDRIVRAIDSD